MITLRFESGDLLRCRFAISPIAETVFSVRAHGVPAETVELRALHSLCPGHGYTPAFLTPPPRGRANSIDEELAAVRATPSATARQEIERSLADGGTGDDLSRLLRGPDAVERLADALFTVWSEVLRPRWRESLEVLENDIEYHARRLSREGLEGLFADLSPLVWLEGRDLKVLQRTTGTRSLGGRGLLLVPSLSLEPGVATETEEPALPALFYGARGTATIGHRGHAPAAASLRSLLGPTRATILLAIGEPTSTTRLARALGLSAGGVADHLKVLADGGLAARARVGLEVRYRQTALARELVEGTAGGA